MKSPGNLRESRLRSSSHNAHRVIRHTCDKDEGARWASGDEQRGGPVEIASGPAQTRYLFAGMLNCWAVSTDGSS